MVLCILISLPLTPVLWKTMLDMAGPMLNSIGYATLIAALLCVVAYIAYSRRRLGAIDVCLLLLFAFIYFYAMTNLNRFPAERLHFLEYGFLAFLFYRAFRHDFSEASSFALGFLCASVFGLVDETVQHFLPNRVFEIRDVATNILASALGLFIVGLLLRVNSATEPSRHG